MSHLHFVSTEDHARRVRQLGEQPWRVHVTGAPALDALEGFEPLPDDELAARGITLDGPTLLVTYHPVTLADASDEPKAVVDAVLDSGLDAVFTFPNADSGHHNIVERLESLASNERITVVRSLGTEAYFTLMTRAVAMVGNSSSGIIESASFGLPVVDVGRRQRGRAHPPNVISVEGDRTQVLDAIRRAADPAFRRSLDGLVNPYGDGRAGDRIAEVLATSRLDESLVVKRFYDLDE
jgi:UDP-hydrolysing UDP-N-acetyl-D-glucosamine 2-epimerase